MISKRMKPRKFYLDIMDAIFLIAFSVLVLILWGDKFYITRMFFVLRHPGLFYKNFDFYFLVIGLFVVIFVTIYEFVLLYRLYKYSTIILGINDITITRRSRLTKKARKSIITGLWRRKAYGPYRVRTDTIPYNQIANYGIYAERWLDAHYTRNLVEYYPQRFLTVAHIELWIEDFQGNKYGFDLYNYNKKQMMEIINQLVTKTGIVVCDEEDIKKIARGYFKEEEASDESWRLLGREIGKLFIKK